MGFHLYTYLHPTMYLLIHFCRRILNQTCGVFTSHYVSINSFSQIPQGHMCFNLHPTMYLLIPYRAAQAIVNERNLHPTMYLLIRL